MSCWTNQQRSYRIGQQVVIGRCTCCPADVRNQVEQKANGGELTNRKVLPVRWNEATLAHEARCPDCRQLAYMLTREATTVGRFKAPFLATHQCPGLPCTCSTDPHNCPEGLALVQAIHDRKKAQGD